MSYQYRNPIVFARAQIDPQSGDRIHHGKIWVMEEDGSEQRQLTFGPSYDDHPALFADRSQVLYSEFVSTEFRPQEGARLIRLDMYTGQSLVYAEEPGCALHHVTISPIDDVLVYHHDRAKRLSQRVGWGEDSYEISMRAINGVWDGEAVIFMHEKNRGTSPREVALVRMWGTGKDARTISLTDDSCLHRRPAVSPDGRWLAWQTNANGRDDEVYLAGIDGSGARNITNTDGLDGHPWFSRDGKWIVFESDRTGTQEIWKIDLETLEQHQLTFSGREFSNRTPRW